MSSIFFPIMNGKLFDVNLWMKKSKIGLCRTWIFCIVIYTWQNIAFCCWIAPKKGILFFRVRFQDYSIDTEPVDTWGNASFSQINRYGKAHAAGVAVGRKRGESRQMSKSKTTYVPSDWPTQVCDACVCERAPDMIAVVRCPLNWNAL